jgi:putative transposase
MKRSRFTEEQIIAVLREHELGSATAEPEAHDQQRDVLQGEVRQSRCARRPSGFAHPDENSRLEEFLTEAMLDVAMLKDIAKNGDSGCRAGGRGALVQWTLGGPSDGHVA